MRFRTEARGAFTLVELLVVIAIIGVLVALLLPAVQAAREAARRAQCQNQLRQLGIGLHNHHDSRGGFPAALQEIDDGAGGVWDHSWTPHILPYIEQGNLYDRYNFKLRWDQGANTNAGGPIRERIKVFVCPSTPTGLRHATRGVLDYVAVDNLTRPNTFVVGAITPSDPTYVGVLGHTKPNEAPCLRRMAEISDGTTNTFLLAECAGRNWHYLMSRRQPDDITAGPWANPGSRINIGGFDPANPTATTGPCAVNCDNKKEIYAFHPAGANCVMADASVQFVNRNLSITLAYAMTSRAGGELLTGQ